MYHFLAKILMKKTYFLLVFVLFACQKQPHSDYFSQIQQQRQDKDISFKKSQNSPLKAEQKKAFFGLSYFKIDTAFRVLAKLELLSGDSMLTFRTSKQKDRLYKRYAHIYFVLKGKKCRLLLLQAVNNPQAEGLLFLPFTDLSSGEESYGAGRYLDLEISQNKEILIDFNLAYNPYCAYNDAYDCPIPPLENHLDLKIEAGERVFEK